MKSEDEQMIQQIIVTDVLDRLAADSRRGTLGSCPDQRLLWGTSCARYSVCLWDPCGAGLRLESAPCSLT